MTPLTDAQLKEIATRYLGVFRIGNVDIGLSQIVAMALRTAEAESANARLREQVATLREALVEVNDCFEAAYDEGLSDELAHAGNRHDAGSLAGLFDRRLSFAQAAASRALAATEPSEGSR